MNGEGNSVDQAALAGIGVAGTISISSADGPYTPFDAIMGLVLMMIYLAFRQSSQRKPPSSASWRTVSAAVIAVLLCLTFSPAVEALTSRFGSVAPVGKYLCTAGSSNEHECLVDSNLAQLWVLFFLGVATLTWVIRYFGAAPGESVSPPKKAQAPAAARGPRSEARCRPGGFVPIPGELWKAWTGQLRRHSDQRTH